MSEIVSPEQLETFIDSRVESDNGVRIVDFTYHTVGWSRETCSFTAEWRADGVEQSNRLTARAQRGASLLDTSVEHEYRIMEALQDTAVPVPQTKWYADAESVFDVPVCVMEHVDGDVPNTWRPDDRAELREAWERKALPREFVQVTADIHAVTPEDVPFLDNPGVADVVDRELDYWIDKYEEMLVKDEPIVREAIRWLRRNRPDVDEVTLIHGDHRIGNMICDDDHINAVLDWELARIGDPHFDLGYSSLRYIAGKFLDSRPELACSLLERDWYYDRYEEVSGRDVDRDRVEYWRIFSIVMAITIIYTGLNRYESGETDDVRQLWPQYGMPDLLEDLLDLLETQTL